jgi:hypothetical protein
MNSPEHASHGIESWDSPGEHISCSRAAFKFSLAFPILVNFLSRFKMVPSRNRCRKGIKTTVSCNQLPDVLSLPPQASATHSLQSKEEVKHSSV